MAARTMLRAALRLLEEQEVDLDALPSVLIEGETSGASAPFHFDEFLESMRVRLGDKVVNTVTVIEPARVRVRLIPPKSGT